MTEVTRESLVEIARQYHPAGFPAEDDDLTESVPAHQRTPEHARFMAAWDKALSGTEWKNFMTELRRALPGENIGGGTQPYVSACMRCFLYRTEPMPGGERLATRVAAAVSVLAPFYIVYATTQLWRPTYTAYPMQADRSPEREGAGAPAFHLHHFSSPQLTFDPPAAVRPEADTLARSIEEVLGCRPFPLAFAGVPLPELRVGFFNGEGPPTLLDALFSDNLAHLP
ncbi:MULTISPECIES: hypothetical protein [unclassified Corallococcus]|uniref:hypothetical protein n=1 Tax=unclassified Corallococcus TaxID=2685029 RepID=UPI001A901050|nr:MULTISPECIES: hypothetical protein [unclassified Corallococcus]MBN9686034.1 hypothetical protein [Corallococcus sp. NCSPR001]WAS82528.1 hypothetical protein O0N60_24750 [Corallococcus sp. NCRR]